jgi:hypothetical protein
VHLEEFVANEYCVFLIGCYWVRRILSGRLGKLGAHKRHWRYFRLTFIGLLNSLRKLLKARILAHRHHHHHHHHHHRSHRRRHRWSHRRRYGRRHRRSYRSHNAATLGFYSSALKKGAFLGKPVTQTVQSHDLRNQQAGLLNPESQRF